jgi:hypothetical protein
MLRHHLDANTDDIAVGFGLLPSGAGWLKS